MKLVNKRREGVLQKRESRLLRQRVAGACRYHHKAKLPVTTRRIAHLINRGTPGTYAVDLPRIWAILKDFERHGWLVHVSWMPLGAAAREYRGWIVVDDPAMAKVNDAQV
jgi:hypothetical protein